MAAKVKDIAEQVGVSRAVVSSVLNGGIANIGYSEQTRRRILEAAEASSYRLSQRHCIGVVCAVTAERAEEVDWVSRISPMLGAIHVEAMRENKLVSVFGFSLEELEAMLSGANVPQIFRRQKVDGLIVTGTVLESLGTKLKQRRMPFVAMNHSDSHMESTDSLGFDEEFTGRLATEHVLSRGHRHVLHLSVQWSTPHYSVTQRRRGYEQAMREAGRQPWVVEHRAATDPDAVIRPILERPDRPTAIFAYNELMAIACTKVMRELRLNFDDVSVICPSWTDEPAIDWEGITTVSLPAASLGQQAFRMLLEKIERRGRVPALALRGSLVERESVRAPAAVG